MVKARASYPPPRPPPQMTLDPDVMVSLLETVTTLTVCAYTKLAMTVLPTSFVVEYMPGLDGLYTAMLRSKGRSEGMWLIRELWRLLDGLLTIPEPWDRQKLGRYPDLRVLIYLRLYSIAMTIAANSINLRPYILANLRAKLLPFVENENWHLRFSAWAAARELMRVMPPEVNVTKFMSSIQQYGRKCCDQFLILDSGVKKMYDWTRRFRIVLVAEEEEPAEPAPSDGGQQQEVHGAKRMVFTLRYLKEDKAVGMVSMMSSQDTYMAISFHSLYPDLDNSYQVPVGTTEEPVITKQEDAAEEKAREEEEKQALQAASNLAPPAPTASIQIPKALRRFLTGQIVKIRELRTLERDHSSKGHYLLEETALPQSLSDKVGWPVRWSVWYRELVVPFRVRLLDLSRRLENVRKGKNLQQYAIKVKECCDAADLDDLLEELVERLSSLIDRLAPIKIAEGYIESVGEPLALPLSVVVVFSYLQGILDEAKDEEDRIRMRIKPCLQ